MILLGERLRLLPMLMLHMFVMETTAYANMMDCDDPLHPDTFVMDNNIISVEEAPIILNLRVRKQGSEQWFSSKTDIELSPDTVYDVQFDISNYQDNPDFEAFQFLMETSQGGSFELDRTGHCDNQRAGGRGDRIVSFRVNGTTPSTSLVAVWAIGYSAVYMTPLLTVNVMDTRRTPEEL